MTMALLGAGLAAVYDLLCGLRRMLRAGRVMTAALDLAFGALCAAGIIAAGLMLQEQITRGYLHAGTLCGAALYAGTAGTAVRWAGRLLIRAERSGNRKKDAPK